MGLTDLINIGKEKVYDLLYQGASAFPHSNDLMHVGILGTAPFLVGKYGSELLGTKIPFFQEHSTAIGFASSGLSELLWMTAIEPNSPYDHPEDTMGKLQGLGETGLGAGIGYFLTKLFS